MAAHTKHFRMKELPDDLPLFLDTDFICDLLGVSRVTVTKMLINGDIEGVKVGSLWRIPRDKFFAQMGIEY
jgi:excisionase family DNA binding protein